MKKVLLPILLLLAAGNLFGQSMLRFSHISVEEGLAQSSVNYILQDTHGFMWFATGDGMDRYDGKTFVHYKSSLHDTSAAHLKYRNINSRVFEDKSGKLWMSTDGGVSYLDWRHQKFSVAIGKITHGNSPLLLAMENNILWCVEPQHGIYLVDTRTQKYESYPLTDKQQICKDSVCVISDGILTPSGLWLTDKAGLLFFDRNKHTDARVLLNTKLHGAALLHDGHLLLTSDDGVYLYDTLSRKTEFIPIRNEIAESATQWKSVVEDVKTHLVYLGATNSGIICKLDPATHKYEFLNFQGNDINCLLIDQSQNLWIGTEGNGAYKLDIKKSKFFCYTPNISNSLEDADGFMVKSIYRTDSGKIWMGTYDKGLIVCDFVTHKQQNIQLPFSIEGQLISTILKDSAGNIVTTVGNKIIWLDERTGKTLKQTSLPRIVASSPVDPIIYSLTEWKKGHYLAGTNLGLYLVVSDHGNITAEVPKAFRNDPSFNSWIYNLTRDSDGNLYIGNRNGFAKVRMLQDTVFQVLDKGFNGVAIRHFYKSTFTQILWIATENGLIAYNEATKHYKIFDETEGMSNSSIYGILMQNDSSLWISTNMGISNIRLHYGGDTDIKAQFINYTSKDGLQSNEFNSGAFFQCADGTFIFGGIAGINWFRPGEINPNPYKAIPVITGIAVNDSVYASDTAVYIRSLTLPYDRNTISFTLRSLEYTKPEQNQFAYMLEGQDKEWVYTASDKVRYSNLQPGNYTFLLKVSNNEGLWNEEPLKISITIQQPYWQSLWFRALVLAGVVILIYISTRYYVKQKIRAKTLEFEKQQALYMERLRISKDVHDDLGSGLSKISLMAQIARSKTEGNTALGNDLQHISSVSKELVDNMRDLIWVLNPDNTTLEHLVARLREYCSDYLENIPVDVSLSFPDVVPSMPISREAQRNVFLTTKESINNCIKHAQATELKIALKLDNEILSITVTDNGKGFDMAHLKGSGNGLRNMKQRIETIGGEFIITSGIKNTTVSIKVPFTSMIAEKLPL